MIIAVFSVHNCLNCVQNCDDHGLLANPYVNKLICQTYSGTDGDVYQN